MKIYLIGMPGSGKTTLGKHVASELSLAFVDLDHEIEAKAGKSIPEMFADHGEEYFRKIESQLLQQWAQSEKSFIMATGGGAPCFLHGIEVINQTGFSIFFDVSVEELVNRLDKKTGRPLLQTTEVSQLRDKLTFLLSKRLSCYQRANLILSHPTEKLLLDQIKGKLGQSQTF
jgi:shikimate kinase